MNKTLAKIEVVDDKTKASACDDGFLRVRRLVLRNVYADGEQSRAYDCDIVSRRQVDAVAVVVHGPRGPRGVSVVLKVGVRPPVVLRAAKALPHDEGAPAMLAEIVAGVLEERDAKEGGVEARAALECEEEVGYSVRSEDVDALGASMFPSPGVTDERVHFRRVEVDLESGTKPRGDGSVMEEAGGALVLPLAEAIRRCRDGEIPDMKTEVGLLRLADAIGYIPALDCFVDDLPKGYRCRAKEPG